MLKSKYETISVLKNICEKHLLEAVPLPLHEGLERVSQLLMVYYVNAYQ